MSSSTPTRTTTTTPTASTFIDPSEEHSIGSKKTSNLSNISPTTSNKSTAKDQSIGPEQITDLKISTKTGNKNNRVIGSGENSNGLIDELIEENKEREKETIEENKDNKKEIIEEKKLNKDITISTSDAKMFKTYINQMIDKRWNEMMKVSDK